MKHTTQAVTANHRHPKRHLCFNTKCILCLLPSLLGLSLFFVLPYLRVLYYSLINNQFKKDFVGLIFIGSDLFSGGCHCHFLFV